MKYNLKSQIIKREISKKSYPIRIRVTYSGIRVDLRPGLSVPEEIWDAEQGICSTKISKYKKIASETNSKLLEIANKVDLLFQRCELIDHRAPTINELKSVIDAKTYTNKVSEVWQLFLDENSHLEIATTKIYKATLAEIIKIKGDVFLNEITLDFMTQFVDELSLIVKNSSIATFVERLKTVLKWAKGKQLYTADALSYKFKLKKIMRPIVYMTHDELMKFWAYEPAKETERHVKNCYCFCAFTGLRFSDMKSLTWNNIGPDYIEFVTKKTSDALRVNLNKYSSAILDLYRGECEPNKPVFKTYTIWYHEKLLKRICKHLEFCDPISYPYYQGNSRQIISRQKWEMLTTHTARKTFVVNAVSLGIPVEVIMKWTGHKNLKNMEPYLKIVDELKKIQMDKFNDL